MALADLFKEDDADFVSPPVIKAIETRYNGYNFRSRTEARWAVYFDNHFDFIMGPRKWVYEPEGLETPFGRYLLDFLITKNDVVEAVIEIKPSSYVLTESDALKLFAAAAHFHAKYTILIKVAPGDYTYHELFYTSHLIYTHVLRAKDYTKTYALHKFKFEFPNTHGFGDIYKCESAIDAAKSARFEFGQSGRT